MSDLEPLIVARQFFAIQLNNTEHLKWSNLNNYNSFVYSWKEVDVAGSEKLEDIYIAVAKSHPSYSREQIKNISKGIRTFPRLKVGSGILGVIGRRTVKFAGVITSNSALVEFQPSAAEIGIDWNKNIPQIESNTDLFNSELEIQEIGVRMLSKLNLPLMLYQPPMASIDDDETIWKENFEPNKALDNEIKEDMGGKITLFYGTNRNDTGAISVNDKYGDKLDELKYGVCEVSIPRGHVQGAIERPRNLWVFEFPENNDKHLILKTITEFTRNELYAKLHSSLANFSSKSAFIFVHGYCNTFAEAARRAAQIAWDVPFEGLAGFYSWPSAGKKMEYLSDVERADASIPALGDFIDGVIQKTGVEQLHLIAHSMGNRILTVTLNNLKDKLLLSEKIGIIHQIVLAAPDIDQDVFRNTILPKLSSVGVRKTIYSSTTNRLNLK
jgi:hypothetical protein